MNFDKEILFIVGLQSIFLFVNYGFKLNAPLLVVWSPILFIVGIFALLILIVLCETR